MTEPTTATLTQPRPTPDDDPAVVLDHLRESVGLATWDELADAAGITPAGLRKIRAGDASPRRSTVRQIESALRVPVGYLDELFGLSRAVNADVRIEYHREDTASIAVTVPVFLLAATSVAERARVSRLLSTIAVALLSDDDGE